MEKKWMLIAACLLTQVLVGCKKDQNLMINPKEVEEKEVKFTFKEFASSIKQMSRLYALGNPSLASNLLNEQISATGNVQSADYTQLLYFWSFNESSLVPAIGLDTVQSTIVVNSFANGDPISYVNGISYPPLFEGTGKQLSIKGADEMVISMPISHVNHLERLSFDASSSNTGPKSFQVYYALGNPTNFQEFGEADYLSIDASKSTNYSYDLSDLNTDQVQPSMIHIKLKMSESGPRPEGSEYKQTTGVFKIDNVNLTGKYNKPEESNPNQSDIAIHYYIFNSADSAFLLSEVKNYDPLLMEPEVGIRLIEGNYFIKFVANLSATPINVAEPLMHASDLQFNQVLSNAQPEVYGATVYDLEVDDDIGVNINFKRWFSLIKIEFADVGPLSQVHKIEITPMDSYGVYAPYTNDAVINTAWQNQEDFLVIYPNFSEKKEVQFHQFLGNLTDTRRIEYHVNAYNEDGDLLRFFPISADIRNNQQVTFRGYLLENSFWGFQINWLNNWDNPINIQF